MKINICIYFTVYFSFENVRLKYKYKYDTDIN